MLSLINYIVKQYKKDGAVKVHVKHLYKNVFYVKYQYENAKYRCEDKIKLYNGEIEVLMCKA